LQFVGLLLFALSIGMNKFVNGASPDIGNHIAKVGRLNRHTPSAIVKVDSALNKIVAYCRSRNDWSVLVLPHENDTQRALVDIDRGDFKARGWIERILDELQDIALIHFGAPHANQFRRLIVYAKE
jgi:hypothetical protein